MQRFFMYTAGTFFGTGYSPFAPATVASFAVAVIWWLVSPVPLWLQPVLLVAVTAIGIPIASRLEAEHGTDPSLVVIDEVAGMIVTYLGVSTGPLGWLAGFFWFRVFDILKPFGVRKLERLPGGLGIMADDLGAGALACVATHLTLMITGW